MQPDQLNMVQPIIGQDGNLREFSWLGVALGFPILGIWYWCTDQTHVQRLLGAKSEKHGQNGALFAGFLKLLPVFLMVFPGTIGYIMFRKGEVNLGAGTTPDYNLLLAQMIQKLVPVGLKGLVAAGMVAALMSCMAAALNSCATLISVDIVKRLRPAMADTRVVTVGRVTTGIIMLLAMAWSTQGGQFGTIFQAINKIPMTFAPAVTTVFLFGLLWKRGDLPTALATFGVGCTLGITYFILDLPSVGRMLLSSHPQRISWPDYRCELRTGHSLHAGWRDSLGSMHCRLCRYEPAKRSPATAEGRWRLLGSSAVVPWRPDSGLERSAGDRTGFVYGRNGVVYREPDLLFLVRA